MLNTIRRNTYPFLSLCLTKVQITSLPIHMRDLLVFYHSHQLGSILKTQPQTDHTASNSHYNLTKNFLHSDH